MVVVWLPVLLLFFMFVVDVGNWFMHKRHLQMQADAGALAGGGVFKFPCADTPIVDATRKYAGDPNVSGPYNLQVKPTNQANVHALVNSTTFSASCRIVNSAGLPRLIGPVMWSAVFISRRSASTISST